MNRTWKIILILSTFIIIPIFVGTLYISSSLIERSEKFAVYKETILEKQKKETDAINEIFTRMKSAVTINDWEVIVSDTASLSGESGTKIRNITQWKLLEARAQRRDELLWTARQLLMVNENDTVAHTYLEEAEKLHNKNTEALSSLYVYENECIWSSAVFYRKGIENFRSLVFLKKEEKSKARNLIDQAIRNFGKVFECYPKDRKTEVAIEVLYKRAKEMGADFGSLGEKATRLQLLPKGELKPGTGGTQREKGRY